MSDMIKHSKKVLSAVLTVTTIVWSVSMFVAVPVVQAAAGDLIKTEGNTAVYLVDADGVTIHPFPHANVYTSWGYPADFSSVFTTDLSGFTVGNDVEFRDGALVRALETPAVYIKSDAQLRPVLSAEVFETLGYSYDDITWLPQSFLDKYNSGGMVDSTTTHPNGTVVKYAGDSTLYLLEGGHKRQFATSEVASVNGYAAIPVITIPSSETYSDGTKIVVKESTLTVPGGVGAVPEDTTPPSSDDDDDTPISVGSGLTVALASDTPAAASVIADNANATTGGAQAFTPFTKVALSAGSDGAVKLTTIKFKRGGISSDSDIANLYLYDGDGLGGSAIAQSTSFNSGIVTFTKSSGLVTIPAGETKNVTLRGDLSGTIDSGKTINWKVVAASDVTTDGATVSGSFPIEGNTMSTAIASDIGYITIANVSPTGAATVNPGTDAHEGWRFSLAASDQDMELRYLNVSMVGSASQSDLANFELEVAGVTIAGPVAEMNTSDEILFDLTASPYEIEKGQTKNISLVFDVVSGSSRTVHFQLQEMYHANVFDTEYGVYTKINENDSWTVIESNSSTTNTTVNSGTLTIAKSTSSPTGNIASGANTILLGSFDFKATGEDVRVSSLIVAASNTNGIDNGKVYFDSVQVGSTTDVTTSGVTFSFGSTMVVPASETKVIEIWGDIENTSGTDLTADTTVQMSLNAGSSNARALSSSTSISTQAVSANTLTVKTGSLTLSENTAIGDASAASPSGVKGDQNVLIGSFVIAAGSGEGATITQITMTDDVTSTSGSSLADVFQNLRLESGGPADAGSNYASGTAIGVTKGSLTDTEDTTYNFNPSPSIVLNAAQQIVVNVYADALNSSTSTQINDANGDADGVIYPSTVTATGNDTSASANGTMAATVGLQDIYIATSGALTVENVPNSQQISANIYSTGEIELYKFKMLGQVEDIDVTRFIINDAIASDTLGATSTSGKPTSTLKNFKLYDGATQIGTTLASLSTVTPTPTAGGYLDFTLDSANPYRINANEEKVLTLKGTISAWPAISSGSTHTFSLQANPLEEVTVSTRAVTSRGVGSSTALNRPTATQTGKAITIRRAYPVVTRLALPDSTLSGGASSQKTIAKFSVTATNGRIDMKKMTFDVNWTDTTTSTELQLDNFKLYRNGSLMTASEYSIFDGTGTAVADELTDTGTSILKITNFSQGSGGTVSSTGTRVVLVFSDQTNLLNAGTGAGEETIASGTTNTYEMKADIANAHVGATTDSDSISVQLLGDATETAALTSNLANYRLNDQLGESVQYRDAVVTLGLVTANNSTTYNFIWSDYSANTGDHTNTIISSGQDWTHGYQVRSSSTNDTYLPLDPWNLSK